MSHRQTNPDSLRKTTRRKFNANFAKSFGAALGFYFVPSNAWGNLEKPTLAGIGAGGKGRADINGAHKAGFQVTTLVDVVDATKLGETNNRRLKSMIEVRQSFPDAKFFTDYREMLDQVGDKIDAVTVSTPDHHHYHASAMAMLAGKHVYCQKPLTHSIWEARMLTQLARQTGVKTQMGNQAHANDHMRQCVEFIRAGIIGKVKEVHAWTNRPIWSQGFANAPKPEAVPPAIDWEQWIGPAPWVDYSPEIAPFEWRGWWDYGTGALGDMACHIMDMPYWAIQPDSPQTVKATQSGATKLSPPINSKISWHFGPNQHTVDNGFDYFWYDGYLDAEFDSDKWELKRNSKEYNHPSQDVLEDVNFRKFGSVVVGEKGKLFFQRGRNGGFVVKPEAKGFQAPERSIPRAAGQDNYKEWMDAITGKIDQSESNFMAAGPFTETVLLGVVAQRNPNEKLSWNADKLEITDRPDLQSLIQREYRKGWQLT